MKKLIIFLIVVILLVIGWITLQKHRVLTAVSTSAPLSCATLPDVCPTLGVDVDQSGCPIGGHSSPGVCVATQDFYEKFGGCSKYHSDMMFSAKGLNGLASVYDVASSALNPIEVEFTESSCTPPYSTTGYPTYAGKPFRPGGSFSNFQKEHTSGPADPNMAGKCFKVLINPLFTHCIDPHIAIGN